MPNSKVNLFKRDIIKVCNKYGLVIESADAVYGDLEIATLEDSLLDNIVYATDETARTRSEKIRKYSCFDEDTLYPPQL